MPENRGSEAVIMKVLSGFPPLPVAPAWHACGQTRMHNRPGMCCFWALRLQGAGCSPGEMTNISSILDFIFLTVSERAAIRWYVWDCSQYRCGAGTEGRRKSAQCVLTQGSFNSPPRIALGRAATTSLAGCRESECEKVSQAEEKGGEKKLQVLRQNTFILLLSLSLPSVALNEIHKPFQYRRTTGNPTRDALFVLWFKANRWSNKTANITLLQGRKREGESTEALGCTFWAWYSGKDALCLAGLTVGSKWPLMNRVQFSLA